MELKNLKMESVPIELDLGLPYVSDRYLLPLEIGAPNITLAEKHKVLWSQLAGPRMPYAQGLLMIPLSSTLQEFDIPESEDGRADFDDENAYEAIDNLKELFSDDFRKMVSNDDELEDQALGMLESSGLVCGTVSICLPLTANDIGEWGSIKDFERFVQTRHPEYYAIFPNSRKGKGFVFRRYQPGAFDFSRFKISEEAVEEKRRGIYMAGFCPSLSEPPTLEGMRRAQQIPVPFTPDNKNAIVDGTGGVKNGRVDRKRTDPWKSAADLGTADLRSVSRQRGREWEKEMPDVWAKLYPRRFIDTPGFLHPKAIAKLNAALLFSNRETAGAAAGVTALVVPKILRFMAAHYFLSATICEAIHKTKFPEDLKPFDVPLPVPAMILVLPVTQKELLGVDGTPLQYVLICQRSAAELDEEMRSMLRLNFPTASSGEVQKFISELPKAPEDELTIIGISSAESRVYETPVSWSMEEIVTAEGVARKNESLPNFSAAVAFKLTQFAFNALLYFNAVPQYMEPQRVHHSVKGKPANGPKLSLDYWSPNIYGRAFKLPPEPVEGEEVNDGTASRPGRKPRPHLRWAHWRHQAYGHDLLLRKWIHIDFAWVQPTEADSC